MGAVTNATSGRVEVCVSGVWGSVCNSGGWDAINAAVVCRQLTLPTASVLTQLCTTDMKMMYCSMYI